MMLSAERFRVSHDKLQTHSNMYLYLCQVSRIFLIGPPGEGSLRD